MSNLIEFYHSDLVDALYFFEYHGTNYKRIKFLPRDKGVRDLYKLIREIKFPRFKYFLPWARSTAVLQKLDTPKKLASYIEKNPPRGKFAEKWIDEIDKLEDILQEIYNHFKKNVQTKENKEKLDKLKEKIEKKYERYWVQLKEESEKLPGISWKRKEPMICLLYPIEGRLSHKLKFGDIAFIEASEITLDDDVLFLHEIVKLLNNTKPINSWVKQDRRGVRAIAYELFTEMQTLHILEKIINEKPNFKKVILEKLETLWIPVIREDTSFDDEELERILTRAYKIIPKHEFDALHQLGELYTELNIVLLT